MAAEVAPKKPWVTYEISYKEHLNAKEWILKKMLEGYGRFGYLFTSTPIGVNVTVVCHDDHTEHDITDYDSW